MLRPDQRMPSTTLRDWDVLATRSHAAESSQAHAPLHAVLKKAQGQDGIQESCICLNNKHRKKEAQQSSVDMLDLRKGDPQSLITRARPPARFLAAAEDHAEEEF